MTRRAIPAPPLDADREANLDLLARLATHTRFDPASWTAVLRQIEVEGYKVVRQRGADQPPKLNVERLAEAIHTARCEEPSSHHGLSTVEDRRLAVGAAAEYARLLSGLEPE